MLVTYNCFEIEGTERLVGTVGFASDLSENLEVWRGGEGELEY